MLRVARRFGSYKLREPSLAALSADGVPREVLTRLADLVEVELGSRRELESGRSFRRGEEQRQPVRVGSTFATHSALIPRGPEQSGGLRELLGLFDGHADHVCWQEEAPSGPGEMYTATIFRVAK
ncbi:MAG TPA: hypothetical protein VHG51_05800 [Longimicrobiaceae bacterium]|nr:hypothetical protein [Longimicrobiaceae bacterium]